MSIVRIRDFGQLALNTDRSPDLLRPGEWSRMVNVDVDSGDVRSAWGESLVTDNPPVEPRYLYIFEGALNVWAIISDGSTIYAFDGVNWTDITPSDTPVTALTWANHPDAWNSVSGSWGDQETGGTPTTFSGEVHFDTFLGTLIVCPTEGVPCFWPGESGRLQPLPGWNTNWRAQMIRSYSNHLVAIGFDDGVVEGAKYRVAWSDAAAEGEIPQSWDPVNPTGSLAGSVQLRDTSGFLTNAKQLRDELIIYKNDSIHRMFFRGDQFVMGFDRVSVDHGCDSPWGVDALGDAHYFVDRGDVRVFNGQITRTITALRIKSQLEQTVSDEFRDRSIVVAYPEREQVWIGVVPAGANTADIVLVYDLVHDAWTPKSQPNTLSMALGPFAATGKPTGDTWETTPERWNTIKTSWKAFQITPSEDGVVFGSPGRLYRADKTDTDYDGNPKSCIIERTGFVIADIPQSVTVQALWPEMIGEATVEIQLGARYHPNDRLRWTPAKSFTIGQDKHVPARITGQPTALRITSNSPKGWRLSALSIEYVEANRR